MPVTRRGFAAAGISAAALAASPAARAQPAEEAAVAQAAERLRAAMLAADRGQLDALTAPQLSYGHSSGTVEDKARFIDVVAGVMG